MGRARLTLAYGVRLEYRGNGLRYGAHEGSRVSSLLHMLVAVVLSGDRDFPPIASVSAS